MKELSEEKRNLGLRTFNVVFCILMALLCVGLSIYYGVYNNWENRLSSAICMIFVSLIPLFFELITRIKLSNAVFLVIDIYIYLAGVVGSSLNVYNLVSWYDILIHSLMGYLIALLGLFFLCKAKEQDKMKVITVGLFCLFFSLGIELVWELFERAVDVWFNGTMQGIKVSGTNSPLVEDTMEDLFCNFSGAFLFFFHYIVDRYTNINFGIKYYLNDFKRDLKFSFKKEKKR